MAFTWNRFAYTNFHELNLDWFNEHFKEIFEEWEELYNTLTQWKEDTDADLAQWKEDTLSEMDTWERELLAALDEWKTDTNNDISDWEADVIADLNEWKETFISAYELLEDRVEAIVSDTEDMVENLAEPFSASNDYSAGDYVIYNGVLYMFTDDHSAGAWTGSDAVQTTATNEIIYLKNAIDDISIGGEVNLFNPYTLIRNVFLDGTTGEEASNNNYDASDFIAVDGTYTVRAFEYSGAARTRVYMYDGDKVYDHRAVQPPEDFPNGYTFSWTGYIRINIDNGNAGPYENPFKYMFVSGSSSNGVANTFIPYLDAYDRTARATGTLNAQAITSLNNKSILNESGISLPPTLNSIDKNSIYYVSKSTYPANFPPDSLVGFIESHRLNANNKIQYYTDAYGNTLAIRAKANGEWLRWNKILTDNTVYAVSTVSLFQTVGCCGDSFSAGYLYNKTDSQYYDPNYVPNGEYPAISYGKVMGRLYGLDVDLFAKGGLTSTTWRTDSAGLPALNTAQAKQLYIICLGMNDRTQAIPIGVEADIDTEPLTPTYLGNMGAIIRAIQYHAPLSKIIIMKCPWVYNEGESTPNVYYNYNSSAIELLSEHLSIPYIETLDDPFFCSSAYVNGLKGLHPTAPLYAGMGKRIGELIGECIINNPTYFYNFYIPN